MRRSTLFAVLTASLIPSWGRPSVGFLEDSPKAWAMVVGVGKNPQITTGPGCPNASEDAKAVAGWLKTTARWPADQVRLMTTDEKPDSKLSPTLANIRGTITGWLKDNVKPGDLIFLYFAGQAFSKPDPEVLAVGTAHPPLDFLLPADFLINDIEKTSWALDRDLEMFYGKKVQVFCCLDTSTSGRGSKTVGKVTPADRLLKSLTPWPGWAAWIASDNGKPSDDKEPGFAGSPLRNRLLRSLGSLDNPNNMMTSLNALKADAVLNQAKFSTRGRLNPGLTLWSGKVAKVEERGLRPVLRRGHGGMITSLLTRVDGGAIFSSSVDSTVKIWKPGATPGAALELDRTLTEPIGGVSCLAISPDGRWIAAGSDMTDGIWLWDRDGQNFPLVLKEDPRRSSRPIRSIGFLPNSQAFVTVNQAGQAHLWELSTAWKPTTLFEGLMVDRDRDFIAFANPPAGSPSVALAAFDNQGRIKLLKADSQGKRTIQGLGPETSALDLSEDGRTLALGDEQGVCETFDLSDQKPLPRSSFRRQFPGEKVERLKLTSSGWLALGTNSRLRLLRPSKKDGAKPPLAIDVETTGVRTIRFSDDGRLLAAILRGDGGWRTRLWRLDDDQAREIGPEASPDRESRPAELAFAGGGFGLLVGTEDGTIRSWMVDRERNRVVARAQAAAPDKSQIRWISPSPDGKRFVLICEEDKAAFLFDFDNRDSTRLKHTWNSLSFLPDGRLVGIIDEPDPKTLKATREFLKGRPVVYDLDKDTGGGEVQISDFLPPEPEPAARRPDTLLDNLGLDRMIVSSDGERIAATRGSGADRRETFFWDKKGGRPVLRWPSNENGLDRVNAVALARVGSEFVACTPEGAGLHVGLGPELRLQVADLPPTPPDPRRLAEDGNQNQDEEFTAAAFAPRPLAEGGTRTIALGTRNHGVVLWTPDAKLKKDKVRLLGGEFRVGVETLTFTDEGQWLVATTKDKRFSAWEVKPSGEAVEVTMEPLSARHEGAIQDVRAWPKVPMVATAGDDSTVRFWSLKDRQLIGTLAFSRANPKEAGSGLIGVAFSPDGRFDCLNGGKGNYKMVRQGQSIRPEEAAESYRDDQLIERIRTAQVDVPKPDKETLPPNLVLSSVSPIGQDGTSAQRTVWLEVLHDAPQNGDGRLTDLRLYRNNIPVGGDTFEAVAGDPRRLRSQVTLGNGSNEFRAVAARGGATEGSSDVVQVKYSGEDVISRVHVLAIGIDNYPTEALKLEYAVRDAKDISDRLKELDVAQFGNPQVIETILLKNEDVDEPRVNEAFRKLKTKVKDRPDDKVVVFLAGHTEQFGEEFGLLLIKNQSGAGSILKYSTILQGLARLDAGQRLVIVDACQTDKILARGKARELARREIRAFTNKTLKYPTQYILASKAGEPALENKELQHGLLTYTLLCGLGSLQVPPRLKPDTPAFDSFAKPADENGDGTVGTDELNRYASTRLPLLAAAYPDSLVARGNPKDAAIRDAAIRVPVSFDPTNASFGLVRLPNPRP